MDLLNEVILYTINAGLATAKDVDIFKDYSPEDPDNCVMIYEYDGIGPEAFTPMSVRSVQVVVRDKSSQSAKQKAWDVFKAFYSESKLIQIESRKCIVSMRNNPIKIDVDAKNRYLYAFNMGITTIFD